MPVYTIKEFAEKTRLAPKNIHTYVLREKLVKNKNKQIDTDNQTNKAFLLMREINTTKPAKSTKKAPKKTTAKQPSAPITTESDPEQQEIDFDLPTASDILRVDYAKKLKEVEAKEKDILIKTETLKRVKGEVIDKEQTVSIVRAYSDTLKKEFIQNIQTLVQDICSRYSIDAGRAGDYKLRVIKELNKSNRASIDVLLKNFVND